MSVVTEHNEPSLYGHRLPPKQEQQAIVKHATPDHNTTSHLEWFREFNAWSIGFLLPVILAYIGFRTVQAKVSAANRQKLIDLTKEGREDEFEEMTIWNYKDKK